MNDTDTEDVSVICENCQHTISMHLPNCTGVSNESHSTKICNCNKPEFYNVIISGKYIGWTEIHCNSCGKLVAFLDSPIENIDDSEIRCKHCIIHKH
jgi:DNA-directed RNA polymerase subunit RPC12/RpoP